MVKKLVTFLFIIQTFSSFGMTHISYLSPESKIKNLLTESESTLGDNAVSNLEIPESLNNLILEQQIEYYLEVYKKNEPKK